MNGKGDMLIYEMIATSLVAPLYNMVKGYYRIVGNFRGVQFSQMSGYLRKLDSRNKYYNGHDRMRPRKLNFEDWPSAKIGPHEQTVCM
jgi:hypothetical protein